MKISLLIFVFAFLVNNIFAQPLTGIKTIPGDYSTITEAIAGLNANGVGSGGVTFTIASGYTETFGSPVSGIITATGTSTNPVVFQKAGSGADPVITAAAGTGTTDGIIILAGSDYFTFDHITLTENSGNNTNTTRMEWGFALLKKQNTAPFDGCQHVVIKNCTITLNRSNTSSRGIYAGNHISSSTTPLAITETTDANGNCTFSGNTINNCNRPVSLNGFNAPSPYTLHDQNNLIGVPDGNKITDFAGGSGIYVIYQNNIKISNNLITESTGSTGIIYGIQAEAAMGASGEITGNTITLKNGVTSATSICGISCKMGSNIAGSEIRISGNIIKDCSFNNTVSTALYGLDIPSAAQNLEISNNHVINNTIPGAGTFYGINVSSNPANLLISGNRISGNKKIGPSGKIYAIATGSSTNIQVESNIISGNTILASSGTEQSEIYGYYNISTCANHTVSKNVIDNLIIGGSNTHNFTMVTGIYSDGSSGTKTFSGNTINNLLTNTGYATGIYCRYGDLVAISGNNLHAISSDAGTPASASDNALTCIKGIDVNYIKDCNVYNNFISDLNTISADNVHSISGLYFGSEGLSGRTGNLYNNTIYLNASSSGSDFGSSAVYCATTSIGLTFLMQNNILVNTSSANGLGLTAAFRRYDQIATNYSKSSDRNCFYAGSPGPKNVIYSAGTFTCETIEVYKSLMSSSGREANSFSELPPFINITARAYNVHLQAGVLTHCESGAMVAMYSGSPIDTDFDGDPRYPAPGYPNNLSHPAKAPDVGADEFAGIPYENPTAIIGNEYSDEDNIANMTIYSFNDIIYINTNGNQANVIIINTLGRQICNLNMDNNTSKEIKVADPGLYIIMVKTLNKVYFKKVICI